MGVIGRDPACIGRAGPRQKPLVVQAERHILTIFDEIPPYIGRIHARTAQIQTSATKDCKKRFRERSEFLSQLKHGNNKRLIE
jgi:hypothetical protein